LNCTSKPSPKLEKYFSSDMDEHFFVKKPLKQFREMNVM